mgnify:CR=1 FL=1
MKTQLLLFSIFLSIQIFTQNQANYWYFGNNAGLDFSSGTPVAVLNSNFISSEGCASICDKYGNLQFYTNGGYWHSGYPHYTLNRNHTDLSSGFSPSGCNSTSQSSVIIPKPGDTSAYYLFTLDCSEHSFMGGLRWTEVDMNLNGGLGGINPAKADQLLAATHHESLTAVKHENAYDYWVIASNLNGNGVSVYLATDSAVELDSNFTSFTLDNEWAIKASPDRTRITSGRDLFDFDPATGIISNQFSMPSKLETFMFAFSPNSDILYAVDRGSGEVDVFQYNLNASDIPGSEILVGTVGDGSGFFTKGGMNLGPDGKIYMSHDADWVDVINCPNTLGAGGSGCDLQENIFSLAAGSSFHSGFVNFDEHIFESYDVCGSIDVMADFTFMSGCNGFAIQFTDLSYNPANIVSWNWNFGDPSSGLNNTSTLQHPTHVYASPGNYTVQLVVSNGTETDTAVYHPDIIDCSVLPVEYVNFKGYNKNDINYLEWETASEENNDYFTIEKSKDGIHFQVLEIVQGNGNTNTMHQYHAIDEIPFQGITYYRLKQTDFENTSTVIKIISVENSWENGKFINITSLYPNPSSEKSQIQYESLINMSAQITISDLSGKMVFVNEVEIRKGSNTVAVNTNQLESGMYLLELMDNRNTVLDKFKLIVQHN